MNKDRLWFIGAGAAFVIIALLGWTLGISPLVDQATAANTQVAAITTSNQASEVQLQKLKTQYANIDEFKTELASLRQSIPSDASLAAFLKEINALCDANNVGLTSVVIADATLYVNPGAAPAATGAAAAGSSSATPTPTPTPTAGAASGTAGTAAATTTGSKPGDFVLLPVTITFTGSFSRVMAFTQGLQTGPRLFVSTSFATQRLEGSGQGSEYQATVVGTVFALKGSTPDTVQIVVPDATPDPTPAPTDTATPEPTDTATAPPTGAPTNTPTAPATTKP